MKPQTTAKCPFTSISRGLIPTALLILSALAAGCGRNRGTSVTVTESFTQVSSGAELEPNDESASPNFLGVLRPGEMMTVTGNAKAGDPLLDPFADEFDGFAIALSEPSEIEFRLSFDDSNGELDIWVFDPAINDIAIYFETDFSPETGFFTVNAPVLDFHIIVRAFTGQANYTLEIFARPLFLFSTTGAAQIADAAPADSESIASGIQRKPTSEVGVEVTAHESDSERALALSRYLGQTQPNTMDEAEMFQSGIFIIIDSDGKLHAAPVVILASGAQLIIPRSARP